MTRIRVGILGYGVIGKRAADAVRRQEDMVVVGVAVRPDSPSFIIARHLGYSVFDASSDSKIAASGRTFGGALPDLLGRIDVLLDCTPSGAPAQFQRLYDSFPDVTVIVQGGEKHSFGGASFNAFANFGEVSGRKRVRVIEYSTRTPGLNTSRPGSAALSPEWIASNPRKAWRPRSDTQYLTLRPAPRGPFS